jgi:hypothetical protein
MHVTPCVTSLDRMGIPLPSPARAHCGSNLFFCFLVLYNTPVHCRSPSSAEQGDDSYVPLAHSGAHTARSRRRDLIRHPQLTSGATSTFPVTNWHSWMCILYCSMTSKWHVPLKSGAMYVEPASLVLLYWIANVPGPAARSAASSCRSASWPGVRGVPGGTTDPSSPKASLVQMRAYGARWSWVGLHYNP